MAPGLHYGVPMMRATVISVLLIAVSSSAGAANPRQRDLVAGIRAQTTPWKARARARAEQGRAQARRELKDKSERVAVAAWLGDPLGPKGLRRVVRALAAHVRAREAAELPVGTGDRYALAFRGRRFAITGDAIVMTFQSSK